jgi:hypothetical protein
MAFETINYIFTTIFILEALIKIIGQGLKSYFEDGWNLFDFVIAIVFGYRVNRKVHL